MKSTKIAIFGCKSTTKILIDNLNNNFKIDSIITISPNLAKLNSVADYLDFQQTSFKSKLYNCNKYSLNSKLDFDFFLKNKFDIGFVTGWQRLIPKEILETFSVGVFGMHGSAMDLPIGRGRSPMNWALIEGKEQFYTNIFKYDPGVDSGDVLDTYKFQIRNTDTAETLHFKNTLSMIHLINRNLNQFINRNLNLLNQNADIKPTYYPKRSPSDSLIDWTKDISEINRFIRAVHPPFGGSYTYLNNETKCQIIDAFIFDFNDFDFTKETPGKVVQVFPNDKFLVKCFGGLLFISSYNCDKKIFKGDFFDNSTDSINYFNTNNHGNFDI